LEVRAFPLWPDRCYLLGALNTVSIHTAVEVLEVAMMGRYAVSAIAGLVVLVFTGPAMAQQPAAQAKAAVPPKPTQAPTTSVEHYRIGPEDMIAVTVWKNDAMSRTVPVRPDGMISLPLLDDVQAAGLTAMELRDVIAKKLVEYMPAPEVTVIVNDVRSFKVSVMGEVSRPARYELKSVTTVLDVLAQAGGFNQFANRSKIVILRPNGKGGMTRIPFNYNKVIAAGGEGENFYLEPGDIVLVP
jgi:polysaccharide biosynthesis/export protein